MANDNTNGTDGNKIDAGDNLAESVDDARSGNGNVDGNRGIDGNGRTRSGRGRRARNAAGNTGDAAGAGAVETIVLENPVLIGDDAPVDIPLISVTSTGKRGRKPGSKKSSTLVEVSISDKDISQVLEWLFRIPTFYDWGAHWELSAGELKDLTERTRATLDQFPNSLIEKYAATSSKYYAPTMLLFTVATLGYARYKQTLLMKKYELPKSVSTEAGRGANRTAQPRENIDNAADNSNAGNGQNPGNGKADIGSIFGRIE